MNFENKLALTTKKYWYSCTKNQTYHASIAEIYGFKIKYVKKVKAELSYFYDQAVALNLNANIVHQLAEWEEMYENSDDYELVAVFRRQDLKYHICDYSEYMEKGEANISYIQYEIENYVCDENLALVEIDEKAYNNFGIVMKTAELKNDQRLREAAKIYLKNTTTDTFGPPPIVETKKKEKNGLNDFIQLLLNISIIYMLGLLLLSVVHLNSNPISDDLFKISMEVKYSEIHKAARDYIVNNSSVRLQTTRILCLSTTKEFNDRLFDKADNNACDYLKKNDSVESLLNLDEVQGSAYENNRSGFLDFILLSLNILAIFYSVRWFFKAIGESSK
jgi:hypothetical protein